MNTTTLLIVYEENPQERGLKILAKLIARDILRKQGSLKNKVSTSTNTTLKHDEL